MRGLTCCYWVACITHLQRVVALPGQLRLPHAICISADARVWRLVAHRKRIVARRRDHAGQPPLAVVVLPVRNAAALVQGGILQRGDEDTQL